MAKKPKIKKSPTFIKQPAAIEEPAKYKSLPISWQISFIDNDSIWGIDVLKRIEINNEELFLNNLPNEIENNSYDNISEIIKEISGKKFNNLNNLIEKLITKSRGKLSEKEFQIILQNIKINIFFSEIYPKLRHFEENTWLKIEKEQYGRKGKTKHHSVNISDIDPKAQKRLKELKMDDIDELFSLRLTGKIRIWGIRKFSYLKILWFDLEHEVCPVSK